jgi:hypothetical protein
MLHSEIDGFISKIGEARFETGVRSTSKDIRDQNKSVDAEKMKAKGT